MAIEATGVENVMGEVAHFWQLRKFQFIEEQWRPGLCRVGDGA